MHFPFRTTRYFSISCIFSCHSRPVPSMLHHARLVVRSFSRRRHVETCRFATWMAIAPFGRPLLCVSRILAAPLPVPFPFLRHDIVHPRGGDPLSFPSVRLRFRSGSERAIVPFRTRCGRGFVSFRIDASFQVPRFRFSHRSNPGKRKDEPRSGKEAMGFDRLDVHTTSGRWTSAQPRRLRDFDAPQSVASRVWGRKRWRWKERRSSRRGGREETRPNNDKGRKAKHSNVGSNSSRQ